MQSCVQNSAYRSLLRHLSISLLLLIAFGDHIFAEIPYENMAPNFKGELAVEVLPEKNLSHEERTLYVRMKFDQSNLIAQSVLIEKDNKLSSHGCLVSRKSKSDFRKPDSEVFLPYGLQVVIGGLHFDYNFLRLNNMMDILILKSNDFLLTIKFDVVEEWFIQPIERSVRIIHDGTVNGRMNPSVIGGFIVTGDPANSDCENSVLASILSDSHIDENLSSNYFDHRNPSPNYEFIEPLFLRGGHVKTWASTDKRAFSYWQSN